MKTQLSFSITRFQICVYWLLKKLKKFVTVIWLHKLHVPLADFGSYSSLQRY